jgi:hypothetical protein
MIKLVKIGVIALGLIGGGGLAAKASASFADCPIHCPFCP